MSRRLTRRAALGLIGAGALGSVTWSGGFSQLRAGRNATVDTASDLNAYLGLDDLTNVDTVPKITNQSGHDMSVTLSSPDSSVEFDVHDDNTNDGSNPTFSIGVGSTVEVDVLADGNITVNFVAELLDSGGSPIGEISLQRPVEAQSQAGQVSLSGNAKAKGNTGRVKFDLENTGTINVTMEGVGIRYTTATQAEEVSGQGSLYVEGTETVTVNIPVDNGDQSSDTRRDFNPLVPLNVGDTKTFEFDAFVDSNGNSVNMKNQDVGIRLYFEDGSRLDLLLQP